MNEQAPTLYVKEAISLVFLRNTQATWFEKLMASCLRCGRSIRKIQTISISYLGLLGRIHKDDLTLLFGIIAADGFIKLSSIGTPPSTLYAGDREYFQFQRDGFG